MNSHSSLSFSSSSLSSSSSSIPRSRRPYRSLRAFPLILALGLCLTSALPRVQAQPGHTAGLAALADVPKILAVLGQADASLEAKARACQHLALVGGRDAVAPLAALLGDPTLSHYARSGLEEIRDPAADDALRAALTTVKDQLLVGVINSIGNRRDAKATAALVQLSADPSRDLAAASLMALARIGTPDAAKAVRQGLTTSSAELRPAAAEAALRLAEFESAHGSAQEAVSLYDAVRQAEVPAPLRLAALRGAILARGAKGLPILVEHLDSPDLATRNLALRAARELPDRSVSRDLAKQLDAPSPEQQIALLRVLADRGDQEVHGAVEALVAKGSPSVKVAALEALGTLGTAHSVPVLVAALTGTGAGATPASEAAAASLSRIPAKETDAFLQTALPRSPNNTRAQMIRILGNRGAHAATAELLRQATNHNATVSRASFEALAFTARATDLPDLIQAASSAGDTEARDKAERAIYTVALKNTNAVSRAEALANAFGKASYPVDKKMLLQVMAMLGDGPTARAVAAACSDADPEISLAALRHLGHWPDATPVPDLLRLLQRMRAPAARIEALRGLVTLANAGNEEAAKKRPSPEVIGWLTQAATAVRQDQPEEKRILVSGLGDLNCPEGLRLLAPYLADDAVKADALNASLRAAKGLVPADKPAARPLLEKLREAATDPDAKSQVEALLQ